MDPDFHLTRLDLYDVSDETVRAHVALYVAACDDWVAARPYAELRAPVAVNVDADQPHGRLDVEVRCAILVPDVHARHPTSGRSIDHHLFDLLRTRRTSEVDALALFESRPPDGSDPDRAGRAATIFMGRLGDLQIGPGRLGREHCSVGMDWHPRAVEEFPEIRALFDEIGRYLRRSWGALSGPFTPPVAEPSDEEWRRLRAVRAALDERAERAARERQARARAALAEGRRAPVDTGRATTFIGEARTTKTSPDPTEPEPGGAGVGSRAFVDRHDYREKMVALAVKLLLTRRRRPTQAAVGRALVDEDWYEYRGSAEAVDAGQIRTWCRDYKVAWNDIVTEAERRYRLLKPSGEPPP